jgi:hypothetical protein
MKNSYQATGTNSKAPFTFKIHRGDGMVLLAMNWRTGKPPDVAKVRMALTCIVNETYRTSDVVDQIGSLINRAVLPPLSEA